jgi:hypothetical protein
MIVAATACGLAATGNYLGQEPPGMEPTRFAPSLLGRYAFSGTFNADLTEFWFTEQDPVGRVNHIEGYVLVGGAWQRVQTAPFAAVPDAMEPHVAPQGDRLFLTGAPAAGPTAYVSERTETGWGQPVPLPAPINAPGHWPMYLSSTRDGTLYWTYLSNAGEAIVRTRKTERGYGPVERMASSGAAWIGAHPFVSADETLVLFDVRPNGAPGDLVVVFRRADGSWTAPQPIPAVNRADTDEMCASLSPDGRYLFFVRELEIWWVDAAVLDPLRP